MGDRAECFLSLDVSLARKDCRLLFDNFPSFFVLAQSCELRMPEMILTGPFKKFDSGN
jgi:hypothetical protein